MSTFLHNSLLIAPILLAVSLINAQGASAIPADVQTTEFQVKEDVVAQTDNQAVMTAPIGVTSSDQSQQFNDRSVLTATSNLREDSDTSFHLSIQELFVLHSDSR